MKDIRNSRIIDGELLLVAVDNKMVYGVIFKDTIYTYEKGELSTLVAGDNDVIKIAATNGIETSKRKEIMIAISNSDSDKVAVEKAIKISGKKKMVVTPFIQSVANCVALNISNKGPYKFKSKDKESLDYVKMYSKEVGDYIGEIVGKELKVTVLNSELVIEII